MVFGYNQPQHDVSNIGWERIHRLQRTGALGDGVGEKARKEYDRGGNPKDRRNTRDMLLRA